MERWPADKVERWPIDRLVPYARNARTHSDEQVAQVAASIREWGWTNPVLVGEDGGIIAGHARVLAGRKLGLAEVPVMLATGWSEAQKRAYVLADNQLALNAGWNPELLRLELGELAALDFNLGLIGFDEAQLAGLTATAGLTDPDEIPEPPAVPIAKLGEVWQLGRHRLMCGDATDADAVRHFQPSKLCLTDPPYGIDGTSSAKNNYRNYVDTRDNLISTVDRFLPLARQLTSLVVLTPGNGNQALYPVPTWTLAWFTPAGIGRGPWGFCCWQPILCFGKDPKLAKGKGCHPDAIVHTEAAEKNGHPCAKPIKLWSWVMERCSESADVIFDPFVGSGTTIIAAEMMGRTCQAIEIDPAYCDVTIERWQNFTGEKAKRHGG